MIRVKENEIKRLDHLFEDKAVLIYHLKVINLD